MNTCKYIVWNHNTNVYIGIYVIKDVNNLNDIQIVGKYDIYIWDVHTHTHVHIYIYKEHIRYRA